MTGTFTRQETPPFAWRTTLEDRHLTCEERSTDVYQIIPGCDTRVGDKSTEKFVDLAKLLAGALKVPEAGRPDKAKAEYLLKILVIPAAV